MSNNDFLLRGQQAPRQGDFSGIHRRRKHWEDSVLSRQGTISFIHVALVEDDKILQIDQTIDDSFSSYYENSWILSKN